MKIGIIGGAGMAGSAIFREAVKRGDVPTAIVRDLDKAEGVLGEFGNYLAQDALTLKASDLASFDVVVNATAVPPAQAVRHVELTRRLIDEARKTPDAPRLIFVLGAGSLTTPEGRPYLDVLYEQPGTASWISIAEQQARQLAYLRTVEDVDWTGMSPSAEFVPGPAGTPVLGTDELLTGPGGGSKVTAGTFAVALLDEIHDPRHRRTRFTVRDENC